MTDYKIVKPLLTRHVEPFLDWWKATEEARKTQTLVTASKQIVLQAAGLGWFEGEKPDPDNMPPVEMAKLGTALVAALNEAMAFDVPNSQPAPQDMPKG
jgi:hypothetical protein